MRPNEKRGRVNMQLSAALEKLEAARQGLSRMGKEYEELEGLVTAARRVTDTALVRLSAMRQREDSGDTKG